jgi:hypothetical protein
MTVSVNLATEDVRTGTTSPQTFSHAGAASGVKGVVLAIVHGTSATDHVSAASYGGVAMTRIQRNTDTATEPGAAELWFLGSGVPQGTQTVSYTPGSTTDDIHAVAITLLGADDLEVVDQDGINENAANPSVTLQYAGRTCMAFAALYGGGAAPSSFTENANCTRVHDHDLGAFYSVITRQTTAGNADFAIGGTASSDDVAYAAIAVSEKLQITGTIDATEVDDTSATSGTVTVTGTAAATDSDDSSAASGTVTVTGTAAATEADDTSAASGTVSDAGISGTVAATEADDTSSAGGTVTSTGTVAVTGGDDSSSAAGTITATGTVAATEGDDTSSASGEVSGGAVTGTVDAIDDQDAASASGTVSGGEQPPATNDGAWVRLTGEYPPELKRRRDPLELPLQTAPADVPPLAPSAPQPAPLRLAAPAAEFTEVAFQESLAGELTAPVSRETPVDDEALAIALLLAA